MASSFYIIEGGVWKKVSEASIYTGSAWNSVSNIYYWNGSAWVKGFTKGFEFTKTITGTTTNFSTATEATSQGWNGTDSVIANLTLSSSAIIKSSSVSTYAFETTGLPLNSQVNLTLDSGTYIVGRGGAGGIGSFSIIIYYPNAGPNGYSSGQPGGPAINIISGVTMNLTNNGTIGGGGGGGGGGNGGEAGPLAMSFQGGSAGGGAGYGDGGPVNPGQANAYLSGPAGNPGTLTAGGAGVGTINRHSSYGGTGGNGGTLGTAGVNAVNGGSAPYGMYNSAAPGGAAGVAINGWSRTNAITAGTILGAKNN